MANARNFSAVRFNFSVQLYVKHRKPHSKIKTTSAGQ
jgi:hypothetical protein